MTETQKTKRPSFDEYFIKIAEAVAERATCPRKKIGAVIVKNKRIIATGYNGAPRGLPHCLDVGCQMVNGHCVRTTHAEQNAVIQCALHGVSSDGATLYSTVNPCMNCAKILANAGIKRVVFKEEYTHADELDDEALKLLKQAGVEATKL